MADVTRQPCDEARQLAPARCQPYNGARAQWRSTTGRWWASALLVSNSLALTDASFKGESRGQRFQVAVLFCSGRDAVLLAALRDSGAGLLVLHRRGCSSADDIRLVLALGLPDGHARRREDGPGKRRQRRS